MDRRRGRDSGSGRAGGFGVAACHADRKQQTREPRHTNLPHDVHTASSARDHTQHPPRTAPFPGSGPKAPGDIISVTYVDAWGRRRTQHNVYIPWSMTVTPISQSDVGSVEACSLFRVSRLNCSITTSDGAVLSSNASDSAQTSC